MSLFELKVLYNFNQNDSFLCLSPNKTGIYQRRL